ncbi:hypothetical protein ACV3P7_09115 [Clostridium perfringens]|nr:hypothetical protein [Clostridium perfringens]
MVSVEQNTYVLKQSDGTIWNFLYDEIFGIMYKICKRNVWSNYIVFTNKTTGKFSVTLLPNDNISIIYEDLHGSLIMELFDNTKWSHFNLLENEDNEKFDIYFKTLFLKNDLLILYSIYNKCTNILTLVSQIIDKNGELISPKLIDQFKAIHEIPFYVYTSNNDILYIAYQKQENNYLLGYRLLDYYSEDWSEFYIIDDALSPFKEYSLMSYEDKIQCLYIKKDCNNIYSLTYCKGNLSSYNYTTIFKDKDISYSAFFMIDEHIWCLWISNNELLSTVSIDGGNIFTSPPQVDSIEYLNISKATYFSNFLENKTSLCKGEAFFVNDDTPRLLVIDNIYKIVNRYDNSSLYYFQYFISALRKENIDYKKYICELNTSDKDILVEKLHKKIKEQENKLLYYENKFNKINNSILSFNENKAQLSINIEFLQDSLAAKEKKLNELEDLYIKKEEELNILKDTLNTVKTDEIKCFNFKKFFDKISSIIKN